MAVSTDQDIFAGTDFEGLGTPSTGEEQSDDIFAGTDFAGLGTPTNLQEEAPPPEPKKEQGFFGRSIKDQLVGGRYETLATEKTSEGVEKAINIVDSEAGRDDKRSRATIKGEPQFVDPVTKRPQRAGEQDILKQKVAIQRVLDESAQYQAKGEAIPFSPEVQAFLDPKSPNSILEDFKKSPGKIIAELAARSGYGSARALAVGAAGAAVGGLPGLVVGSGAESARQDFASTLISKLKERGADLSTTEGILAAVRDEKMLREVQSEAAKRAAVVGGADGLAALVGAKALTAPFKSAIARFAAESAAQGVSGATLGAAGEFGGQLAEGKSLSEINARDVAAEAIGEFGGQAVEVGTAAATGLRGKKGDAAPAPTAADSPLETLRDLTLAQNAAREEVAKRGGDPLEQELAAAQVQAEATSKLAQIMGVAKLDESARRQTLENVEQDYTIGTAQGEENAARDLAQAKAQTKYEAYLKEQKDQQTDAAREQVTGEANEQIARVPAEQDVTQQAEQQIQELLQGGPDVRGQAFDQIEQQQAEAKTAAFEQAEAVPAQQTNQAEAQRQLQQAEQPLTEPAPRPGQPSPPATTALGEVAPEVFRTLQERRAAAAAAKAAEQPSAAQAPPAAVQEPAKGPGKLAPPRTLAERRARESAAAAPPAVVASAPVTSQESSSAKAKPVSLASTSPVGPQQTASKSKAPASKNNRTAQSPAVEQIAGATNQPVGGISIPTTVPAGAAPKTLAERRAREKKTTPELPSQKEPSLAGRRTAEAAVTEPAPKARGGKSQKTTAARETRQDRDGDRQQSEKRTEKSSGNQTPANESNSQQEPALSREPKSLKAQREQPLPAKRSAVTAREQRQEQQGTRQPPSQSEVDAETTARDVASAATPKAVSNTDVKTERGYVPLQKAIAAVRAFAKQGEITGTGPIAVSRALNTDMKTAIRVAEAIQREDAQQSNDKPQARSYPEVDKGPVRERGSASVVDPNNPNQPTLASAKRALREFFAEYGENSVELVNSLNDLPADVLAIVRASPYSEGVRGLHLTASGKIYIIADAHPDNQDVLKTAVHEFIAHRGLRAFLGEKRRQVFADVFKNATNRKWLTDYAEQYGFDLRNVNNQIAVADEYIAYLSEDLDFQDQPLLQRVYDELRAILRALGLKLEYTDADLKRLLRMSRANARSVALANANAKPNMFGQDMQFAHNLRSPPQDRSPLSQLGRLGNTLEDQANYNSGTIGSRIEALRDFGQKRIQNLLATIPRRNLKDFIAPGKMDSLARYTKLADRMDGRRNELMAETETLAKRWLEYTKSNRPMARILGELMHASTLAGVDPTKPYVSTLVGKTPGRVTEGQRQRESERKAAYDALKKFADRLDPDGKQLYNQVRDSYAADRERTLAGITERINQSKANGQTKKALLDEIRKRFEQGKVAGPYFPLARFGKYWAVSKDSDGNVVSYIRSEEPREVRAWREEMKKAGYKTNGGTKSSTDTAGLVKEIDSGFVSKVTEMANEIDSDFADQIWQMYLQSLPETSLRKQFLHRQGRLGYTADALRAFGHNKFHAAHQTAKLEYMHRMEGELRQVEVDAAKLDRDDDAEAKWAVPLADEMKMRHEWARNPQNSAWANNLTALGFAYYLGSSPAAALINFSQTAIVALPTIGAEFGMTRTATALLKSAAQWAGSRGPLANRLRGDERAAFDEALRVGLFSQTRTTDLAELGEQGESVGAGRAMVMKIITWLFQATEQANREITFLAAYRLAKASGMSQEASIDRAENLTWDSHFQYQSSNRPRAMQGDTAKVLFLFRQYSTNMTYRLARDFRNGVVGNKNMPPEERAKALKRMGGLLTMTFLNAGVSGMPLLWLGYTIVGALMGDDDEPYDAEGSLRTWMQEMLGETGSSMVMDGTVSTASGATLSSRVGLGSLWLQEKPAGLNAADETFYWFSQVLGPMGGLAFKGFKANELAEQDYGDRAIEQASPKAVTDVMKFMRYLRNGVTNKRGDELIGKDELTKRDLFLQGMGFTPLKISQQYEKNRSIKGEENALMQRRGNLMNRLFLAVQSDDPKMIEDTIASMSKFSEANPTIAINAASIISSARQRSQYSTETINGIRVEPKLRYLQEKYGNN